MAESIVTIQGVFTTDGTSAKGPYTRYDVKDAGGNKYQTFKDAIGLKAQSLKGQQVKVTYHEETRGQYTNNVLDNIEAAGGSSSAPTQDEFRRSKHEMRRTEAFKIAATLGAKTMPELIELGDAIAAELGNAGRPSEDVKF